MAGMSNVGTIEYEARINTAQLKKDANDVEKTVDSTAQKGGESFSNAMVASTAAITVAFGAMSGLAVKSFADYEQLTGGVETLFKSSAGMVKEYANNAYKTAGLSANEYMETVTSFSASLLQGLGGDTVKASKIADRAITDMSDNANKMGTSMDALRFAYQGFAKDNFTMLDTLKIGYGGSATEMARLVNDTKVMGDAFVATAENVKDVPFDKMVEGIGKVQDAIGITGTTSKEATTTISGSWNSLKSAFTNVLTGIEGSGEALSATMLNMFDQLAEKVPVIIGKMVEGMMTAVKGAIDKQLGNGAFDILSTVAVLFTTLAVAVTAYRTAVTIATTVQALFNAVMAANPAVIITMAIIALVAALTYFFTQTEMGKNILATFTAYITDVMLPAIQAIGTWFMEAWNVVVSAWGGAVSWFQGVWNGIKNVFSSVVGFFQGLWGSIVSIFGTIGMAISNAIAGAVKGAINRVIQTAANIINGFIDAINVAVGVINKLPGVKIGSIGRMPVPQLAKGGIVTSPTLAMIGEGRESEAVIPLSKLDAMMNGDGGGGRHIENHIRQIIVTKEVDGEKLLRKMAGDDEAISKGLVPARRYA